MKKISLFLGIVLFSSVTVYSQQLTLNAESGNRAIEVANCWQFAGQTYTSAASERISGSFSLISGQMNSFSLTNSYVKTPWMKVGAGNITFQTKLGNQPNTVARGLRVSYIAYNAASPSTGFESSPVVFYTYDYTLLDFNVINFSVPIPVSIQNSTTLYKIMVSYVGQGGSGKVFSDNYVFPGTYWSNPANSCNPLPLVAPLDSDGDGVIDSEDEYPNDPTRAYNTYFPTQTQFGTLAFEDNWPTKGDYDFNDVVIDYNFKTVTNAAGNVVEIVSAFILRASGANYNNGFGFSLDGIASNKISKVEGNSPGSFASAVNGVEFGQTTATFIVFDNYFRIMPKPGTGVGVNTEKLAPFVMPINMLMTIKFIENGTPPPGGVVHISQLNQSVFNYFIVVNGTRGREVHMPDRVPTALASMSLLGTGDDSSNPATARYYRTSGNLPWAINIVQGYQYTIERASIDLGYNYFIEWASSAGVLYPNWYMNLPGYRNSEKIY